MTQSSMFRGVSVALACAVLVSMSGLVAQGPVVAGVPWMVWVGGIALGVQWLAFVPAAIWKSERFYDLVGALTYLTLVVASLGVAAAAHSLSIRQWMVAGLVVVWAGRLGLFLALRVRRAGHDRRFDELKLDPGRFLVAWSVQGLWVYWTSMGALLLIVSAPTVPFGWLEAAGLGLWLCGFFVEVVADRQKSAFRAQASNRDRWIDSGLWSWSRHPNYFGEIVLWTGIFVIGLGSWTGGGWIAAWSPVFVLVLLRYGSGVPLLERSADERWGHLPAYVQYRDGTPVLWPRPPRG